MPPPQLPLGFLYLLLLASLYFITHVTILRDCSQSRPACTKVTAVTTSTRPKRVFSSVQTCILVDINQQLSWFLTHWSREDSFSISRALGRACQHLSHFCNTFAIFLLYRNEAIKNAVVIQNNSLSFCPSFSDEGTFSVRAREQTRETFD